MVVRSPYVAGMQRAESKTVCFEVAAQDNVVIDVFWRDGRLHLERSDFVPEGLG